MRLRTAIDSYFDLHVDYPQRQIAVGGEFDVATAQCLLTAIAAVQRAGGGDITVRLDDVTLIDAAGFSAVASADATQSARGACLRVTGVTELLHAC